MQLLSICPGCRAAMVAECHQVDGAYEHPRLGRLRPTDHRARESFDCPGCDEPSTKGFRFEVESA